MPERPLLLSHLSSGYNFPLSTQQPIGSNGFSGVNRAFIIGIILNLLFVVIELGAGVYLNSVEDRNSAGVADLEYPALHAGD